MTKARDLADLISAGNPLADGAISVSEVSGAAPTASPTFTGTVNVDGVAQIRGVTVEDSSGTTKGYVQGDADGLLIASDGVNNITFDVNAVERMRIGTNGRVGIGVTAMNDATLEIQPSSDIPQIKLTQNNVPDGGDGWKFHNSGPTGGNLAIIREGSGVDTEYMRITTSGNVGIGTSSPSAKLDIPTGGIRVNSSGSDTNSKIGNFGVSGYEGYIEPYDSNAFTNIVNTVSAKGITFQTGGSERFRIGSSGELGIGGATYGTSGQVLTSGGSGAAPTWADAATGGMTQITSGTIGTNASYSFSLGTSWWNTYQYVMFFYDATYQSGDPPSGTSSAFFRLGTLTSNYEIAGQGGSTNNSANQSYGWLSRTSPGDNNPIFFIGRIYTDGTNTSVYTESSAAGQNGAGFQSVYAPTTPETFKVEQPYFGSERYRYEGTITFYGVK